MASWTKKVSVFITILSLQYGFIMAILVKHSEPLSNNLFARDLLPFMFDNKSTQNVVYSPASIYASLGFLYLGAHDTTAREIRAVLRLDQEDKKGFAKKYAEFVKDTFKNTKNDSPQFTMANGLYVSNTFKISKQFSEIAQWNFNSKVENVNFIQPLMAEEKINKWIEQETNNHIKNILQPNVVNNNTTALLVNGIYFKARLLHPFHEQYTGRSYFHVSPNEKVKTELMFADDQFGYAELDDLNAKVLEMPYENSDISIWLILPNEPYRLENLEKTLKEYDLNGITTKLVVQRVAAVVPKFRLEVDINLKKTLKAMNCSSMFGPHAHLNDIFSNATKQNIADIKHKALLDFSEGGSYEAVVNQEELEAVFFDPKQKFFIAIRPFFFIIRSKTIVYFVGHVAKF